MTVAIAAALARCLPRLLTDADPERAARALRFHGLSAVAAACAEASLQPAARARVNEDARAYAAQFMAWRRHWHELLAGFGALPVLVLKGAALAHTLYPEPHWRMLGDLDLLIEPEHRARADAALRAAGYRPGLSTGGDLLFAERQYLRRLGEALSSRVDLHWALSNRPVLGSWGTWVELWTDAVEIPALEAHGLSPEHALLQACVHRSGHHRGDDRMIWLLDIHLLWAGLSTPDQARVAATAAARGIGALLGDGLEAAQRWFGTALDPALAARLRAGARTEAGARVLSSSPSAWQDLVNLPRWRDRFRYLGQILFPPRSYMRARYPDRGPLPWLYLRRGLGGLRQSLARLRGRARR